MRLILKEGEYNTKVSVQILSDDDTPLNIEGIDIYLYWGSYIDNLCYSVNCTIQDAENGLITFNIPSSLTESVGTYHGEFRISSTVPPQMYITDDVTIQIVPSL